METTYKKGGTAGSKGVEFQVNLLSVFLLNAFRNLNDWKLSTEDQKAGKFDDVVLVWPQGAVLLQAKCKENKSKKITLEDLMSVNSKNDEFSLPKYFLSYQEIKDNFKIKNVVICTNAGLDGKALKHSESQSVSPENMLYHEDGGGTFYTFKDDILPILKENVKNYLEKNSKNKDLSEDVITDENLQNFLKDLQFFANYPAGNEMGNIIERILTYMDLRGTISSSDIYPKIMDWFQQKNGVYLTQNHARAIFLEILRDKQWELLEKYNVRFEHNDFNFSQQSKQIYHITAKDGHLLQEIKIYRALKSDKKNTLYINSVDDTEAQKQAIEAFNLPNYTLLIIVSPSFTDECATRETYDRLKAILDKFKYKKIVLVANDGNTFFEQYLQGNDNHEIIDGNVSFKDLARETQERILNNKSVEFQGECITLKSLLETQAIDDYEKAMCPEILEKLIKNEKIRVGQMVEDISRNYISRTLMRNTNENLEEENNISMNQETVSEENVCETKDRVMLITDIAGMGKSTVLIKLATIIKRQNPRLWVIRIELNHHTAYLKELQKNRRAIDVMEFLQSNATKVTNHLEKFALRLPGKVVLMLDGVDEICPDYTELAMSLLVQCANMPNFARVFVTARLHMTELLEAKLQVKSFMLQPFTEQNQIDFLSDYWTFNLKLDEQNKEKCRQYVKDLISKIDKNAIFTAIPLQVKMMAEIFQENNRLEEPTNWIGCKEYLSAVDTEPKLQNLNIAKLYELFIQKKKDVFVEKSNPSGNSSANRALINQFKESLVHHRSLALNEVLNKTQCTLFTSYRKVVDNMEATVLNIGIVQKVDDELHFLHRTFAEYFVAESIVNELKRHNENIEFQRFFVDDILLGHEFNVIRAFLNNFLQKVLNSLPAGSLRKYKAFTYDNNWWKWRNFHLIHHLAEEGHPAILHFLLKCTNFKIVRDQEINIAELFQVNANQGIPTYVFSNTLRVIKFLLRRGGVNIRNENGDTPLYCAVRAGHLEMVKFLLEQGANINNEKWDESSLHQAVKHGHFELTKFLVEKVANTKDWTVLETAIEEKQVHIATYFLDRILEEGSPGKEPILAYAAAYLGRLSVLKGLLEQGLNVNTRTGKGESPIFGAVQGQQLDTIRYLVDQGADINSKDDFGNTPLHLIAYQSSSISTTKLLVDLGIDVNSKNIIGRIALHNAAARGNLDLVGVLVKMGADINMKDMDGRTAVSLAASLGYLDILKLLVQNGGDINITDKNGNTAFHLALDSGDTDTVTFFTSHQVDVNTRNNEGRTALHIAAKGSGRHMVEHLVQLGMDVNIRDNDGRTALHLAAALWPDTIELLVRLGVDVDVRDDDGCTPLHLAAKNGSFSCIDALLKCDADVDVRDNFGRTPLFLAAEEAGLTVHKKDGYCSSGYSSFLRQLDTVSYLVNSCGADVNLGNDAGRTALHEAVWRGQPHTVELLVQLRADVNARDGEGRTPLHLAAEEGLKVAKYLVENGAAVKVRDSNGETAADLATKNGYKFLLKYLKSGDVCIVEAFRRIFSCLRLCDFKSLRGDQVVMNSNLSEEKSDA